MNESELYRMPSLFFSHLPSSRRLSQLTQYGNNKACLCVTDLSHNNTCKSSLLSEKCGFDIVWYGLMLDVLHLLMSNVSQNQLQFHSTGVMDCSSMVIKPLPKGARTGFKFLSVPNQVVQKTCTGHHPRTRSQTVLNCRGPISRV